jgi:hypothetical protein
MLCSVRWLPFVKPSLGDPRLAINESLSGVISDSWTNGREPSSRRNLQPSCCPPAPKLDLIRTTPFGIERQAHEKSVASEGDCLAHGPLRKRLCCRSPII